MCLYVSHSVRVCVEACMCVFVCVSFCVCVLKPVCVCLYVSDSVRVCWYEAREPDEGEEKAGRKHAVSGSGGNVFLLYQQV